MSVTDDPLVHIQIRYHLEQVNQHILHGLGEIRESPGKLSLVWTDPVRDMRRFLSVKITGEEIILVNGRRYPATTAGLRQGLRACLSELA
jgi:hypothetical protein